MTPKKVIEEKAELKAHVRMAAEDRRQQILDVAVQLFSQKGFRGTTTKEIALAAGVNEAIIFRHFATKRELYSAIMDQKGSSADVQALQRVISEAMERGDDRKVFESFAFHLMEFHEHDDTAMRILLYSALEGHELAEMIFNNHILKHHNRLAEYIKKRIDEGAFRPGNPIIAVRGFVGMVMNHVLLKKFFHKAAREFLNLTNHQAAENFADLFLASMTNFNYETQRHSRK
ncbi:MAG TPA: helix-turn-helix domain-containing protein [Blastocatellia bacterium]|nr:helix-turn-helix domain-containing protein [Blastocatellia bacterium]